ncbi:hypothetical protein NPS53_09770 [Pseudomonas putida]|uniref:hypothetical protein n=1 Tax=Pseudomonas putida TaxID=303 RepID=UPI002363F38A|nr:hypothetical protein [Pseudomonas putida]MDD2139866.1 hypothetical protein [Pseudomonas putida]HDS1721789.1 hypothetical protein [Pseudomonas putida]
MEYRTTWLAELSEDELRSLNPWRILTAENARGFLIMAARDALGAYKRFGLARMDNDELLHEVYPMLHDALPGILSACVSATAPETRDRYIFGSLKNLIRRRLAEQVFGRLAPTDLIYMEEVSAGDDADDSHLHSSHALMIPYLTDVNAYLEAHPNYQPQFLSESQYVPEEQVQMIHRLIEMFRHYLTSREVDVLRNLLLNYQDRCMVALEVGTTPKMVSRYRQSIQKKMVAVLKTLGWTPDDVNTLLGKPVSRAEKVA